MKKLLALFIVVLMVSAAGCGSGGNTTKEESKKTKSGEVTIVKSEITGDTPLDGNLPINLVYNLAGHFIFTLNNTLFAYHCPSQHVEMAVELKGDENFIIGKTADIYMIDPGLCYIGNPAVKDYHYEFDLSTGTLKKIKGPIDEDISMMAKEKNGLYPSKGWEGNDPNSKIKDLVFKPYDDSNPRCPLENYTPGE